MAAEYDAFLSYRRKDLDRAKPLLAALETTGVRVWRDENDLPDNTPITPEIRSAVGRSKTLIALYSLDYPSSHACFEELSSAWIAAQHAGEFPYARVLILNPEPAYDHIPAVLQEQQSIRWPTDASGFAALANQIRVHIGRLSGTLHHAGALARPQYYPGALIAAPRFVGRGRELWDLHGQLTADRISIITGVFGPPAAQVRGMGGNGKSMLAREYAIRFGSAFPGGVFWLNAYGNDDVTSPLGDTARDAARHDQMREFAVALQVPASNRSPDEIEAGFWRRLRELGAPCLWIVDDLPSGLRPQEIEKRWSAGWGGASTLITTRSTEYGALGSHLDLDVLSETEALKLLTVRRTPESAMEMEAALDIVRELGSHPLAIEVAGGYLSKGFENYGTYLQSLKDPSRDAEEYGAELRESLPTGHDRSIRSTLSKSVLRLGENGLAFLQLTSVLAVAPIPLPFVEHVFKELPDRKFRIQLAIDEVDSLSLTRQVSADSRSVHTLVSRIMRFSGDVHDSVREAAIRALARLLEVADDIRRHEEVRREIVHARHLVASGPHNKAWITTAVLLADHDFERAQYISARDLFEQLQEIVSRLLGPNHPDTLYITRRVAHTLRALGHIGRARDIQEQLHAISIRLFGPKHVESIISMNDLATTVYAQGDVTGGKRLQVKALEMSRTLLGVEHHQTLIAMNNLGLMAYEEGDLTTARALQDQALAINLRTLGPEHRDVLAATNNLGLTILAQGDLTKACELFTQVYESTVRLLGPDHPYTLTTMSNLAETIKEQGDLSRTRSAQAHIVETSTRVLGPEHEGTLKALHNLAATLTVLGEWHAARALQERVYETRRKLLGLAHPSTLSSMLNLAGTLYEEGELEKARELQEAVLDNSLRTLGSNHSETTTAMRNLAKTKYSQGDLKGARRLQETGLASLVHMLGAEHPDVLDAKNNLALILHAQGDLAAARKLEREVFDSAYRNFGRNDPRTITIMDNLAQTAYLQGDLQSTRELQAQILDSRRECLGAEHPETMKVRDELIKTIYDQGDVAATRELLEEEMDINLRRLGPDDPDTLKTMNNLASAMKAMGDVEKAKAMQEHVLEANIRLSGYEHVSTLTIMDNLALTYVAGGELKKARELQERALQASVRLLGPEDPHTTVSAWNLFRVVLRSGDEVRAGELFRQFLAFLLERDPSQLGREQMEIRQMLEDLTRE